MKIFRIILAWWYLITNKNNALAKERLEKCAKCKFRVWFVCSECGCPLQAKARSIHPDDLCPKGFWIK